MNREFTEADIPSTIHGIIASRMDQLEGKRQTNSAGGSGYRTSVSV
jgi:hypothetical protein